MKVLCALACLVAVASGFDYKKDITTVPMTVDQEFFDFILRHNWQPVFVKEYFKFIDTPVLDETKYVVSIKLKRLCRNELTQSLL